MHCGLLMQRAGFATSAPRPPRELPRRWPQGGGSQAGNRHCMVTTVSRSRAMVRLEPCVATQNALLVTGQSKRFSLAEFERFAGSRAGNPKMSLKMVTSGARVGMLADQMRCTPDEQQLTTSNATNPIKRPNNGWDGKCRPADQVYCSLCGKHTGTRSIFWRRLCRVTYKGANPYMFSDTCCTTNPRAGAQVDLIGAIVHAEFAGCVVCCG